mmetsp:Transcript_9943/g.12254  ORF Transcript_9943/g.12254 Transcript_9943/m.12254 type:complete len:190 (-) Transcript_9943:1242-1811(-)
MLCVLLWSECERAHVARILPFFPANHFYYFMESLRNFVGFEAEPKPPPTFMEQVNETFQLSYTTRIVVFAVTLLLGLCCCFIAATFVYMPRTFAKWYTLGSILLIASSMFLMGPWKQMKTMFHRSRALASIIYIFSIIGTLYAALHLQRLGLTIVMIVVQVLAMLWYGLSFIPFAQEILKGSAKQILPL